MSTLIPPAGPAVSREIAPVAAPKGRWTSLTAMAFALLFALIQGLISALLSLTLGIWTRRLPCRP